MIARNGVYVIGAGGHAKVVIRLLQDLGESVVGVFDDNEHGSGDQLLGCPIHWPIERIVDQPRRPTIIAIGDNAARRTMAERYDLPWMTAVHPRALVDPSVKLGAGTVVFAGAIVQVGSSVGDHVIINHAATVDHDCTVGNYVHLAPGVHLAGHVVVEDGALMGIGAVAIPRMQIPGWTTTRAGSVITRRQGE
jgi:sugar O-acyltransferase (sialic acid O-acetyltransferase NeuD family)